MKFPAIPRAAFALPSTARPARPALAARPVAADAVKAGDKALFKRPGVTLAPSEDGPQVRSPVGLADFFGALVAAERLAKDASARAAADLMQRRAQSLKVEEQRRRANEQRVRRVVRHGRQR